MPNKISQFWQELKRRNVIRVITVYSATAFVILELLSIIIEPLGLPDWTLPFAIVFLCIGFMVAVILSWIYDIHPEEGIQKTDPVEKERSEDKQRASNGWKIASYISFVVIVGLILLNIFSGKNRTGAREDLPLTIAIKPFQDERPEGGHQYVFNNLMNSILESLSKTEGLTVKARSTTEQYRNSDKTPQKIGEELGVSYLIEGYGTLLEDIITINISLTVANSNEILWSEPFERKYTVRNLGDLKSDIALRVLEGVQATISVEDEERIKMTTEIELASYDQYMQAEELLWEFQDGKKDTALLLEAEKLYRNTVEQEPTFARAYLGLAKVYWEMNYWKEFLSPNFMETFNDYIDIAFELDDQLDELYLLKGKYFQRIQDFTSALSQYKWALYLNPNSWEAYRNIGAIYINRDHIKSLENLFKAVELYNGSEIASLYEIISNSFAFVGFYDQSKKYAEMALNVHQDSLAYIYRLARNENWTGNFDKSIELCLEVLSHDPLYRIAIDRLAYNYMFKRAYDKAYPYYKMIEPADWMHVEINIHRFALVYCEVGNVEEAEALFKIHEDILQSRIELGRAVVFNYYDLAGIYAYHGKGEEALDLLDRVRHYTRPNDWFVTLIKYDPLFESIRDEPRFQQLVRELETNRKAEYERVRQWLLENDLL
jgi:TolB-like protein